MSTRKTLDTRPLEGEYIAELLSEARWERLFESTANELGEWAERIKEKARRGEVEEFDFSRP